MIVRFNMGKKIIFPHELIGEEMEVVNSTNKSNIGVKGKIINETKFTVEVEDNKKKKTLLKRTVTFKLLKKGLIIDGKTINRRPEERIKGR